MQVPKTLRNALITIRETTLADAILSKDIEKRYSSRLVLRSEFSIRSRYFKLT